MNRRKFISNASLLSAAPLALGGIPFNIFGKTKVLENLFDKNDNDNILVLIQLHGGNDGLNTFVPMDQYDKYYELRANIALPYSGRRKVIELDSNVSDSQMLGMHPDMYTAKRLYDEESMAVVQNVGYENYDMSHFSSRDIFHSGGEFNNEYESGWMGRYLNTLHPNYPEGYPSDVFPDPLAMEVGKTSSLAFQRNAGINMGLSVASPQSFYDLISGVGVNPPADFPNNYHGDELEYLMQMEKQANSYAEQLKNKYNLGSNATTVDYPTIYPLNSPQQYKRNSLAEQLKITARLISGGSKTKIYIVKIGGFDTHAEQVESYDTSTGRHAALLYHLSTSVKSFFDDLKKQGLDNKVLAMTFSEFGRRAYSNASYGSDHGKAAPVMLFGPALSGGIYGENANLSDLDRSNLKYKIDYRRIYTSILQDWLGADDAALSETQFNQFIDQKIDLFGTSNKKDIAKTNDVLENCYPNPVKSTVTFDFTLQKSQNIKLSISTSSGNTVSVLFYGEKKPGTHQVKFNAEKLQKGLYFYSLELNNRKITKQFIKI